MNMENTRSRAPNDREQTSRELERTKEMEVHKREVLNALVVEQVLHALGEPEGLLSVQVRPLWEGHFRVNIFVGADLTSARVADSYFVVVDSEGNLLQATPVIQRQYSGV